MFKSAQIQIVPLKKYQQPKYLIILLKIQTLLSEELKKMSIHDPSLYLKWLFSSSIHVLWKSTQ